MSRRQSGIKAHLSRAAKVAALAKQPGTPGEQQAAQAALVRLGGAPASRVVHLDTTVIKKMTPPASSNQ